MRASTLAVWALRLAWALLPVTLGGAVADAVAGRPPASSVIVGVALWAAWAAVLLATLLAHPVSLTTVRVGAPVAMVVGAACAARGHVAPAGLVVAAVAAITAFLPDVGFHHVNGAAYGDERRFPLRPPGALLLGPVPVAWLVFVALPAAAVALVAARPVVGAPVAAVAVVADRYLGRALHRLSRRWFVFVPAGVVLHDHLALADPVLFVRRSVRALGPAPADTDALDLTLASPGLALELDLDQEVDLGKRVVGTRLGDEARAQRLLFTPTRPGLLLAEARRRGLP